jgi:hypothetical protein
VRNGSFFRKSDSKSISRFRCRVCQKTSSQSTGTPCFNQKKRRINEPLKKLLCSGVSQRRAALILNINKITVARRLKFLAEQARLRNQEFLLKLSLTPLRFIQFDEMETHEHTKLKPLSIAIAVEPEKRIILGLAVSEMPAKGLLAAKSVLKYGRRKDFRKPAMIGLLRAIKKISAPDLNLRSDEKPVYRSWIKEVSSSWLHETTKGQRGCIVGQGELKKIGFDPIFSLNHSCAMIRANVNRLFRRTWCTTKKKERLQDHLDLYMNFHNEVLIN